MKKAQVMSRRSLTVSHIVKAGVALAMWSGSAAYADDTAPAGRAIGYAFSYIQLSVNESEGAKAECPEGLVELGPREQFKAAFPEGGAKRTVIDTQLRQEADIWFPKTEPDQFPYRFAGGKTSRGLDLDGKVKPTDFTSPEGKPGIDNQLFRVIGCYNGFREAGSVRNFYKLNLIKANINRAMIELTDVDSLVNDDDVTITSYRGREYLVADATGNEFLPGGTQRVDMEWGKQYIHSAKGKIVNGVLMTQPMDFLSPHETAYQTAPYDLMRDARFELKLTPEGAQGLIGGYVDIETLHASRNRTSSTHHLSYGQEAWGSIYRALIKLADGFPDPKTGKNTAISGSYDVKMVQVRVVHPDKEVAEVDAPVAKQFADTSAAK